MSKGAKGGSVARRSTCLLNCRLVILDNSKAQEWDKFNKSLEICMNAGSLWRIRCKTKWDYKSQAMALPNNTNFPLTWEIVCHTAVSLIQSLPLLLRLQVANLNLSLSALSDLQQFSWSVSASQYTSTPPGFLPIFLITASWEDSPAQPKVFWLQTRSKQLRGRLDVACVGMFQLSAASAGEKRQSQYRNMRPSSLLCLVLDSKNVNILK